MTTPPAPDHQPAADESSTLQVLGIVADKAQINDALLASLLAHRNFNLTATSLQQRENRLKLYRDGRSKVLTKEVQRTAKEYDVHMKGEAWTSYLAAKAAVEEALAGGGELPKAALNEVMIYGPVSVRLYDGHKAAVKARKDEMDRLSSKIAGVAAAREKLLTRGIGARTGEKPKPQGTLPGIDEQQTPTSWMDESTRQVVYDTLSKEMRLIDGAIAKAANDKVAAGAAEQDKRQYSELLDSLSTAGLLDGLTPDDEDETAIPDGEDDGAEPEVEFHGEAEGALEDPTKHGALAPAIQKNAEKRRRRKAEAEGNGAKKTSKRSGRRKQK